MGLFDSKKLKELEKEKEEVLLRLNSITEKEDNVRHLNDVLRKMRIEVAELNEKKLRISDEIEPLVIQKEQLKSDLENIAKEIFNLRQIKIEEQNAILAYTSQLDDIKAKIKRGGSWKKNCAGFCQ